MLCAAGGNFPRSTAHQADIFVLRSSVQGIDPDGKIELGGRPSSVWFFHLSKPELIPVRHAQKDMDLGVEPAISNLRTKLHHSAASFLLSAERKKMISGTHESRTSVRPRGKPESIQLHSAAGNRFSHAPAGIGCEGNTVSTVKTVKHMNNALKYANDPAFPDLREAVLKLRTANDAISVLVSALTYQVTAQTLNQHGCDYCGARYQEPGPIAWTSHHCNVLVASETIISECVQQLLRERAVVKNKIERYLFNRSFLRRAM